MSGTSIGSGLGGWAAIAAQPTYGATFVTPTKVPVIKSGKATWDPHLVYGGPYLEGGITVAPAASRVPTYLDAKGTLMGDMATTNAALLLKTALASSASLTQLGTTSAWELGGATGANMGVADVNGSYFDMQFGVPTIDDGVWHPYNFHSCVITKAEWVFDRAGLVTYSYDFDAQLVETTTALITPTFPTNFQAFSMASSSSLFKVGALGSEASVIGVRKATFTLERGMALDRIYLGQVSKTSPVTNAYVKLTATLEADFTPTLKTALWDLFLSNTPISLIATSVGPVIGGGNSNTFGLQLTNAFIDSNAEPNLDGPDIVKNSLSLTATVDSAADAPLKATLITADTTLS